MAICLKYTILEYPSNTLMLYLENYKSDPKTDFIFVLRDPKNGNIRWFQRKRKHFFTVLFLDSNFRDIVS